jgi:hypothetical protein
VTPKQKAAILLLTSVFSLGCWAIPCEAYFERIILSSRTVSLGGAFVSLADDPSAAVVNPAGLTQITSIHLLTTYDRPYGLSDLEEHYVAAAVPTSIGVLGLSWHRLALRDVTSEDLFTIAFARDYIRNSQDASLTFGGSLDIARVAFADVFDRSKTVITGSLSVLLRPFPIIGMGYTARNIGQPSLDLMEGGGKTHLKATHAFGWSYHWERRFIISYQRERGQDRRWRDRLGLEMRIRDDLQLRAGLNRGDVTGGLGVTVSGLAVDVGVESHESLGLSYLVSLGIKFPWRSDENGFQK